MADTFDDGPDSPGAERNREAIVEMANLTNGVMGGLFEGPRSPGHVLGLSRPHSDVIWGVRVVSCLAWITLGGLAVLSPLILGLTVGANVWVTGGLFVLFIAAMVVFGATYRAEIREIARRTGREDREHESGKDTKEGAD